MSGYKRATVTISQDEYNRLRDADRKLRSIPDPPDQPFLDISAQTTQRLEANLNTIQERQANFDRLVSGLNVNIRDLERSTNQAILQHEKATMQQVQNYTGCLWDYFNQAINEHASYFTQAIEATHSQYQQELMQYSRQVRRIAANQEQKYALAVDALNAAEAFCQFIEEQYAHEAFAPGQVEKLKKQLIQAQQNLDLGLSEAVILTAQQVYTAFSDLHIELERLQNEWQMLLQAAWEACSQVLAIGESSRVIPAIDLDGNLLPYTINTEEWSQGRFLQWMQEVTMIKEQLESTGPLPNTETLIRWLEIDLPGYHGALADIVLDARVNALNSQLRINIADLVVQALQEQGFGLETSDYEASDMRNAYQARLTNLAGNEVVVQVVPTGAQLGSNELQLESLDQEVRTEHELQQRWSQVSRSLSQYGLEVGSMVREDVTPYQTPGRPSLPLHGTQPKSSQRTHLTDQKDHSQNGDRTHSSGFSQG